MLRTGLTLAVALAVLAGSLGAAANPAAAQVAAGHFEDDDGGFYESALEALAAEGVLGGTECADGRICPQEPMARTVMAVWLVRAVEGADPAPITASLFGDIDAELWEAPFVDRLFDLDITKGCSAQEARFCPEDSVTRAHMAVFLTRAFNLEAGSDAGFADIGGSFAETHINALAAARITAGCRSDPEGPRRFCPNDVVTRGEMAVFLARALRLIDLPGPPGFTMIDSGYEHACGLRADGTVVCWGNNSNGQADPPDENFKAVTAGRWHSCGLRTDDTVACWGSNDDRRSEPPERSFEAVDVGTWHSCGLLTDKTITCWGGDWAGQAQAPEGRFHAVTAGDRHTCGLRDDLTVVCWGGNAEGQANALDGKFDVVSAGGLHTCGVRTTGDVVCWGSDIYVQQVESPAGKFETVTAGGTHSCGTRTDGTVECWGENAEGQATAPSGEFSAVSSGGRDSCGLRPDGTVECWGHAPEDPTEAPDGTFESVTSGWAHSCGLRADNHTIVCWGESYAGKTHPPQGRFSSVSGGAVHSCGVREDGTIVCWGDSSSSQSSPPEGGLIGLALGSAHSCGVREDGTIVCWGASYLGQAEPPDGSFTKIASSSNHSCALTLDEAVVCWGLEGDHLNAPEGRFTAVAAGYEFSCGIRADSTVVCWSSFSFYTTVPDGSFLTIDAGPYHACGVRVDGSAACWGDNASGQLDAPNGTFSAISTGSRHTCGLRDDGTVECWGVALVEPPEGVERVTAPGYPDPSVCRPYGVQNQLTAGFPLPAWVAPSSGTLRVAVLFVDFPDAAADHSTELEAELGLPYVKEYVESVSYGRLEVQFTPLHRWLRAEQGHAHYAAGGIDAEAVRLADPEFDFSEQDIVLTIRPSSHFGDGNALGFVQTQEGARLTMRVNFTPVPEPRPPLRWAAVGAHEFLHTLGLLDMYPFDFGVYEQPEAPAGQAWIESRFGIMLVRAFFLASEQDSRLAHMWHYPDGFESTAYSPTLDALEMLAWSRWQLGWLQADEILCMTDSEATVALHPVAADPGQGTAMAAIPLSAHEVIVLESRRRIGLDAGIDHVEPNGARTTFPGLGSEGVLVYTVDAALGGGQLPIKVAGDSGNGQFDTYPVLSVGQSVTVRGYTITVVSDNGTTHTVTITTDGS